MCDGKFAHLRRLNPAAFDGLGVLDMTGRGLMSLIKQAWAKTLGITVRYVANLGAVKF